MKRYVVKREDLHHNIRLILEKAAGKTVWGVIKGDGYGLGVVNMARELAGQGIDHFAVTDVQEVRALRQAGFDGPVLMMSATAEPDTLRQLLELDAIVTVSSPADAAAIAALGWEKPVRAHVKLDTGMGRYGFLPSETGALEALYREYPCIAFEGIYTHFYNSSEHEPTEAQFAAFTAVVEGLKAQGIDPGMIHCCNSSAFLKYPKMHCDAVRVGSGLLGRVTVGDNTGLRVIGQCQATVEELHTLPAGHSVGYGAGWRARRETRTAVIPIGYHNGFAVDRGFDLWRLSDCVRGVARYVKAFLQKKALYVSINGKNCRVLGHVGMVNLVADVTDCPCQVGDLVQVNINPLVLKNVPVVFE